MQTYKDFQPTSFDSKGLNGDQEGISAWFVLPTGRNRDSDCLAESNFHSALKALGGESETVQVHRFGHWACGWFEIIVVAPDTPAAEKAEEIVDALEDYPIVSEADFSEREWEAKAAYWRACQIAERVELCQKARVCVFAARRDEMPQDVDQYIAV